MLFFVDEQVPNVAWITKWYIMSLNSTEHNNQEDFDFMELFYSGYKNYKHIPIPLQYHSQTWSGTKGEMRSHNLTAYE